MRILHIDTGRQMGGGQWQVLQLLRGLTEDGVSVRLLARGELLRRAVAEGFDAGPASLLATLADAPSWDLLHAHDARAHSWAALYGGAAAKLIVARRVAFPVRQGMLSRWKYGRACRYIAISGTVREQLLCAGVAGDKIDIVPDGVSIPARVIPYDERPGGRLLGIVKDSVSRPEAALTALGLQSPRDLADDMASARMLVYLSESEGLGSAALLAMAHAVPVIASRTGGLAEAVEDGVSGILVRTLDDAAAAVRRLREDPELAARMGLAGRDRAMRLFSLDTMVDGTIAVYRKVWKEKGTR